MDHPFAQGTQLGTEQQAGTAWSRMQMVDLHGNGQCAGTAGTVIGQNTHGVVAIAVKIPAVQH